MKLKKQYRHFASLLNKVHSKGKDPMEDLIKGKPELEKILFFWNDCGIEDMDTDSVLLKTQEKIRQYQKQKKKVFLYRTISIAASVALLLGVGLYHFYQTGNERNDFKSRLAEVEHLLDGNSQETTLIMSEKQFNVEENGKISYNENGDVVVDQQSATTQIHVNEEGKAASGQNREELDILSVPKGRRVKLELSDGSLIWVNSGSRVVYPHKFLNDTREIYVQGEIYIEAAPDKNRPFIVNTNDFDIKVLGTKFNISTYRENGGSNVVLVEGSVEVTGSQKEKVTLKPNEAISVNNGILEDKKWVDVAQYISWKDGLLLLRGEKLSVVAFKLSNYYGKPVSLDPGVADMKIYGKLDLKDNLSDVMKSIASILPLDVRESNNEIFVNKK